MRVPVAPVVLAIAVLGLLPACESSSAHAGADASSTPASRAPADPAAATATPDQSQARPPRPPRVTMRVVRHQARAQRFRPYSGPRPPAFSETAALRRTRGSNNYSLGLRDLGIVHEDSSVEWHPVWIIADQTFIPDINDLAIGGPILSSSRTPTPHVAQPGWSRSVTMLDARTGRFFLALTF
jgi:hypothetical protein